MRLKACGSSRLISHALSVVLIAWPGVLGLIRGDEPDSVAGAEGAIVGQVVDETDRPVVGAKVELWRQVPKYRFAQGPNVTSDAEGRFRLGRLPEAHYRLVVEKDGYARSYRGESVEDGHQVRSLIVMQRPVDSVIELKDEAGRPVVGARVREYRLRGPNGAPYFPGIWLETFGISFAASDTAGRLKLRALPQGESATFTIDHPLLAPVRVADVEIKSGVIGQAVMHPGARLTFHFHEGAPKQEYMARVTVDLRDRTWDKSPSCMRLRAIPVDQHGTANVAIESGDYSELRLEHDDYFITPRFEQRGWKNHILRIESGQNDELWFQVRRKVTVRGRVVDETGAPMQNLSVLGEIANEPVPGKPAVPPEPWITSDHTRTDKNGEYSLASAPGRARVSVSDGVVTDQEYIEFVVPADGPTAIPVVRVRPIPKVVGIIRHPDGIPAAGAIVRLRGNLRWTQPAVTNRAGRFELEAPYIPVDEQDHRVPIQPLVAFEPLRPLAVRLDVRLDQQAELELKLEPHEPEWLLSAFRDEMNEWERGEGPRDDAGAETAVSRNGRMAPELDGMAWLNTSPSGHVLADFRGKYVLLDFWFTACGPCHREFPTVKLIHELYKDKVVVIGVHNNSALPESVREHATRVGMTFPIVVDHPDGRVVSRYIEQGAVAGFPSYVLIGPDGTVLLDKTIPSPGLGHYKLEILRNYLLSAADSGK